MRKTGLLLALCFLFLGQAFADEPDQSYGGLFAASNWEIGPEIFYHKYREPDVDGIDVEIKGMMYGFYWSYTERRWLPVSAQEKKDKPARWMVGIDGSFSYGGVDYDGALTDGTPYTMNNMDNFIFETRLLFGPDFPKEARMETIYTGFGFRYLNNDSSDPAAYERESKYFYLPVGITTLGKPNDSGWSVGGTAEFDIFLAGVQKSHLSDVGYADVDNHQHKGYGARGSIRFCKKGQKCDFIIEPFLRYWKIQTSAVSSAGGLTGVEPKNDTTEVGAKLIWRF